jgi:hypothetical protein
LIETLEKVSLKLSPRHEDTINQAVLALELLLKYDMLGEERSHAYEQD